MDNELMTLEQARTWLRAAVETQGPAFIYNLNGAGTCYYLPQASFPFDHPQAYTGCLIGTALSLAGKTHKELLRMAGTIRLYRRLLGLSQEATNYFDIAQSMQDAGKSWGESFHIAENTVATSTVR